MSFSETIFLFFLALIIFGPKKLPEIARQVGKWMNEFRRASNEFKAQIEHEITNLEVEERKKTILPPSAPPEGTASRTLNAASSEPSQTVPTPADGNGSRPSAPEAQATAVASEDEPLFASAPASAAGDDSTSPAGANEAVPAGEAVTTSESQESHV